MSNPTVPTGRKIVKRVAIGIGAVIAVAGAVIAVALGILLAIWAIVAFFAAAAN